MLNDFKSVLGDGLEVVTATSTDEEVSLGNQFADKYNLPLYLKQNLELTKRNIESLFGKEKEKQEGLGKWFG